MHKKKDRLESKVLRINHNMLKRDGEGHPYIPWCDFNYHTGIIKAEFVCRQRECEHYHRLYISEESKYLTELMKSNSPEF